MTSSVNQALGTIRSRNAFYLCQQQVENRRGCRHFSIWPRQSRIRILSRSVKIYLTIFSWNPLPAKQVYPFREYHVFYGGIAFPFTMESDYDAEKTWRVRNNVAERVDNVAIVSQRDKLRSCDFECDEFVTLCSRDYAKRERISRCL